MLSREHGWAFITATALTLLRVVTAEAVGGEGVNGRAVCIRDGDVNCPPGKLLIAASPGFIYCKALDPVATAIGGNQIGY